MQPILAIGHAGRSATRYLRRKEHRHLATRGLAVFTKIALGIITVAALLFIGACAMVVIALDDVADEIDDSNTGDEAVVVEITGKPGTTCTVDRLEGMGLNVPGFLASCTVPGSIVLVPPNTYFGDRATMTIRQTSDGLLSLKVTGCGGKLTNGKTDDVDDVATVGCD